MSRSRGKRVLSKRVLSNLFNFKSKNIIGRDSNHGGVIIIEEISLSENAKKGLTTDVEGIGPFKK